MTTTGRSKRPGRTNGGPRTDAIIVGSGPNGLAAAVTLARAGLSVELLEAQPTIGGGARTEALFGPGVVHDICAAVHPLAVASPFLVEFDLVSRGVRWRNSPAVFAHPLHGLPTPLAYQDLDRTCAELGSDGGRWRALMSPLIEHSDAVVDLFLSGPLARPQSPAAAGCLASRVLRHGGAWDRLAFRTPSAAALLTGVAAHAVGRLPSLPAAAVAMLLGHLAHRGGWPLPRGGSATIVAALAADAEAHGAVFHTGHRVTDLRQLPPARVVLLDVSPREFLHLAGDQLPRRYRTRLERFRYGPGAAKVDFLLSGPVPWRDPRTGRAATVHLGGTRRDIHRYETLTARGTATRSPFVLVVDPVAADPARADGNRRPLWAYAHVPHGSPDDPIDLVGQRLEEFAPGFRDVVLAHRSVPAAEYETYNPNYVGGDIAAGAMTVRQSLARPVLQRDPYPTALPGVYLCSASTPPGPGVHGMCGYRAARSALCREFGIREHVDLRPAAPGS